MNARLGLDVVDVKQPCCVAWESMSGDDRTRFCAHCGKHVHNLSAMSLDEAQKLICEGAGRLCIQFERDHRGRVLTLDYQPVRSVARTWRFWTLIGCTAALAAAIVRAVLWSAPQRTTVILGEMVIVPAASASTAPMKE